jgi:anti-anti-sigma regulatory factor
MSQPAMTIKADNVNPQKGNITIVGELSINNTVEIKKSLIEQIKDFEQLSVKLQNIANIDVSGIQLLQALQLAKPNNFEIEASLNDDIKSIIENAGFNSSKITQP